MNKKIITIALCCLMLFTLFGCGAPKLEDKKEKADYSKMKDKTFNAKNTYLENVICNGDIKSDLYPNNKVIRVYEKGSSNGYNIVVTDCDKNSDIRSRLGSKIDNDNINITNAEVVAQTLGNRKSEPMLLVKQSEIEKVRENELEEILKNNKSYKEIDGAFVLMMEIKEGKLNYDKGKYSKRVEDLLKEYENEKIRLDTKSKEEEKVSESISRDVKSNYKAKFGTILEANQLGTDLTIKFKIKPSYSNKATIDQNGFNVEDLILNQGASQFDTINYWAVADMEDGSENKVVSFKLNKDLINSVKSHNTFGNQIIDKASDIWILPSLRK